MRKLLNKPWFVVVLALAALLAVGWQFLPGSQKPAPVAGGEPVEESQVTGEEGEVAPRLSVTDALKAIMLPTIIRDPFALPPKPTATEGEQVVAATSEIVERLHVSAIWVQGAAVYLLANGRVCQPGDTIDRFTIETAAIDGAWIKHSGGRSFVPVGQDCTVKSTVPTASVPLSK